MKLRLFPILLVTVLLFSSCSELPKPQGPSALPIGTYLGLERGEYLSTAPSAPQYSANASSFSLGLLHTGTVTEDAAMAGKTFLFGSEKQSFTYLRTERQDMESAQRDKGDFYTTYDAYRLADIGQILVERGSQKVLFYTTDAESEPVTALPTKDAFAATAKDFLAAEMGLNVSEEYEISAPVLDAVGRPTISMIRVIHGYKTDDDIAVWLNDRGEVDAVNAIRFGSLDAAAKGLTKELLDQAHSLVKERIADAKLPQGYETKEPYLTTNNEGRVFLSVPLAYTTADGVNCGDIVSINVN